MAEMTLDENERKKLYRKMLAESATSESTKKYSFNDFEKKMLGDKALVDKISNLAIKREWAYDKNDFYNRYFPEFVEKETPPTPKPSTAEVPPPAAPTPQQVPVSQEPLQVPAIPSFGKPIGGSMDRYIPTPQPVVLDSKVYSDDLDLLRTRGGPQKQEEEEFVAKTLPEVIVTSPELYDYYGEGYIEPRSKEWYEIVNSNPQIGTPEYDLKQELLKRERDSYNFAMAQQIIGDEPIAKDDKEFMQNLSSVVFLGHEQAKDFAKRGLEPYTIEREAAKTKAVKLTPETQRMIEEAEQIIQERKAEREDFGDRMSANVEAMWEGAKNAGINLFAGLRNQMNVAALNETPMDDYDREYYEQKEYEQMYKTSDEAGKNLQSELYRLNVNPDVLDAINKGNYAKIPEAILQTIANVGMSAISSFFTAGGSMYYQTLPDTYREGVEAIAKEKGITPEEVIRSGEDAKIVAQTAAGIISALERAGAGRMSKSIANKGGYKAVRDYLIRNGYGKTIGRAGGLTYASSGEGATEYVQQGVQQLSRIAAASDDASQFFKKIPKEFLSKKAFKERLSAGVGGFVGVGGAVSIGRGIGRAFGKGPDITQFSPEVQGNEIIQEASKRLQDAAAKAEGQGKKPEAYVTRDLKKLVTNPEAFVKEEIKYLTQTIASNKKLNLETKAEEARLAKANALLTQIKTEKKAMEQKALAPAQEAAPVAPEAPVAPAETVTAPEITTPAVTIPAAPAVSDAEMDANIEEGQKRAGFVYESPLESLTGDAKSIIQSVGRNKYISLAPVKELFAELYDAYRIFAKQKNATSRNLTTAQIDEGIADFEETLGLLGDYISQRDSGEFVREYTGRKQQEEQAVPEITTPEAPVTETAPVTEEAPVAEETIPVAPETEEDYSFLEETELTPEEEAALLAQEEAAPVAPAEEEINIVEPGSELSQKILDNGEQVVSRLDAEKRIGDGERLFGFNEQDDSLVELSLQNLGAFPVDTIIAVRPEAIEEAPEAAPAEVVSAAPAEEAAPQAPAAPAPKAKKAPAPKAETKQEAPKTETKKEEAPKTEAKPVSTTPQEGATVEIPAQRAEFGTRKMVFKDGEWKQNVGGDILKVGPAVQQQAQEAFAGKEETKPAETKFKPNPKAAYYISKGADEVYYTLREIGGDDLDVHVMNLSKDLEESKRKAKELIGEDVEFDETSLGRDYNKIKADKTGKGQQLAKRLEGGGVGMNTLSFGKYNGKTIDEVFEIDKPYILYLNKEYSNNTVFQKGVRDNPKIKEFIEQSLSEKEQQRKNLENLTEIGGVKFDDKGVAKAVPIKGKIKYINNRMGPQGMYRVYILDTEYGVPVEVSGDIGKYVDGKLEQGAELSFTANVQKVGDKFKVIGRKSEYTKPIAETKTEVAPKEEGKKAEAKEEKPTAEARESVANFIDNNDGTAIYNGIKLTYTERKDGTRVYKPILPDNFYDLSKEEQQKILSASNEPNEIEKQKRSAIEIAENKNKPISFRFSDFKKSSYGEGTTARNYIAAVEKIVKNGGKIDEGTQADYERFKKVFGKPSTPSSTASLASQVEDIRSLPPAKRKAAQQALEERYGKEDVEKMIEITANFTKIIDDLEQRGVVKIDCP